MAFLPVECRVQVWRAGYEVPGRPVFDDESSNNYLNGILVATDQRVVFIEEKGALSRSYRLKEGIELSQVLAHKVSSFFRVKGLTLEFQAPGGKRAQSFANLYEVDPISLKPVQPQDATEVERLLGSLLRR